MDGFKWLDELEKRLRYRVSIGTDHIDNFETRELLKAVALARLAVEAKPWVDGRVLTPKDARNWLSRFSAAANGGGE